MVYAQSLCHKLRNRIRAHSLPHTHIHTTQTTADFGHRRRRGEGEKMAEYAVLNDGQTTEYWILYT